MVVSWYARTTEKGGFRRDYHLYDRSEIPQGWFTLLAEIENACRYAYGIYGLKIFALQCWKLPEVRRFHRTWLMEFAIEYPGYSSKPRINSSSFDTSDKILWDLREDFRSEGRFKPNPRPRLIDPLVNPWTASISSGGAGKRYDLNARKHGLHSANADTMHRSSHGPSATIGSRFKPVFRRPLVESWKENIGAVHSSD